MNQSINQSIKIEYFQIYYIQYMIPYIFKTVSCAVGICEDATKLLSV